MGSTRKHLNQLHLCIFLFLPSLSIVISLIPSSIHSNSFVTLGEFFFPLYYPKDEPYGEQRLRTCQDCIDRQGLSEQSLVMTTPKYHKRYILPVGDTISGSERIVSKYQGLNFDNEDNSNHVKNAVQATIRNPPTSMVRKGHTPSPSPRPANFSFTDKQKASPKRTASPLRSKFPLLRSGSLSNRQTTPVSSRPTTPNPSRPTTPNTSNMRRRYPSEPRKSASVRLPTERDNQKDIEHQPSKSKRLLKALLSRRKSKKDDTLYTFLDEY